MDKKHIVIVGGGYAGLNTALLLAKGKISNAQITLIDRADYHLYYPNLYEVATAEEDFVDIGLLKKSIAIKFREILPDNVEFVKGEMTSINRSGRFILVGHEKFSYDYLVLAAGAVTDFFGIPGMQENALTLKSLDDALLIKDRLELLFQSHQDVNKKLLRVVIGGGGFTGVEFAGELLNLVEILCLKYNYPREKVEVMIVEGANQLLPGLDSQISKNIYQRFENMRVLVRLNNLITQAAPGQITVNTGESINFDLLIWTGGVKSQKLPFSDQENVDRKGRAVVDEHLEIQGSGIFVAGDNACVMSNGRPAPQTATQAIYQAEFLAGAIKARLQNHTPRKFFPKDFPYVIPVRGKWAVAHFPSGVTIYGYTAWLLHFGAELRYFNRLLGPWQAVKLVFFDEDLYTRNDVGA